MEQSKIRIVSPIRWFQSEKWLDERTFERIFAEHYQRVFEVSFRLVGDRHTADDLASEAFWRLWTRPPAQDENIGGWLYRVATRLGYNLLRSNRRRAEYETRASTEALDGQPSAADPQAEAEKNLERARVRSVLRQMPLRDVQILILRHSGCSYQEVALAAGVSPTSVGKLLNRAEEKFERLYQKGDRHAPEP